MTDRIEHTGRQLEAASRVAITMDAMVGRLTYDAQFAADLSSNPRQTLAAAGMDLDKEAVEVLMATDPERFDKMCEALFGLVDSEFLQKVTEPSCA